MINCCNSQDPSPHPMAEEGYPLILLATLQCTGGNKNSHPCPLTVGNSKAKYCATPLEEVPEPLPCVAVRPPISSRNFSNSLTSSGSFIKGMTFQVIKVSFSQELDRQGLVSKEWRGGGEGVKQWRVSHVVVKGSDKGVMHLLKSVWRGSEEGVTRVSGSDKVVMRGGKDE